MINLRSLFRTSIMAALLVLTAPPSTFAAGGQFIGRLILDFTDGPREGVVMQRFEYVDPEGRQWVVPAGTKVDGASIPQPLWSAIGGPWEGEFRQASVIHDYFCQTKDRGWRNVHKVFFDAMLTGGVSNAKAKLMYAAVVYFGPKWKQEYGVDKSPRMRTWQNNYSEKAFEELKQWIEQKNPPLNEIEALVKD